MKRLGLLALCLTFASCAGTVAPVTPGTTPTPLATIQANAKTALDDLNTASVISLTALTFAKTLQASVLPATALTAITDGVRAYNCALLDPSSAALMADGTKVSATCAAHNAPMLGIVAKLGAVIDTPTLNALVQQGITAANQALAPLASSGNAALVNFATVAQATLVIIAGWK